MKPKRPPQENPQGNLFKPELSQFINMEHALVKLANTINWQHFDDVFGASFDADKGRPAISTRLMVTLHYMKYTHNLSIEWVSLVQMSF